MLHSIKVRLVSKARLVFAFLTAVAIFSTITGCGGSSSAKTASEKTTSEKTTVPITIRILKPFIAGETVYEKMTALVDFERQSNVHVEWNTPPQTDFEDRYKLIMASGDLPDAIIALPEDDIVLFGRKGLFIELGELIPAYMPNLRRELETAEVRKIVTDDAGRIYSMPFIYEDQFGINPLIIREDWLRKAGCKMPGSTDEWYKVLKAFKEGDMNGNGVKDEWPFSGDSLSDITSWAAAFGVADDLYVAEKYYPKDGKVHYGPIQPRFREAVEWLNRLYTEGLIDPDTFTNDKRALHSKMVRGLTGATRGYYGSDLNTMNISARKNGDKSFHAVTAPVPGGPYGDVLWPWVDPKARSNGMVITHKNRYPVETARWADYWYSDEGRKSMWGPYGKQWKLVDGKPVWLTDYLSGNGKSADQVMGSVSPILSIFPTKWLPGSMIAQGDTDETREGKTKHLTPEKWAVPMPSGISYAAEDNDRYREIMTNVRLYMSESVISFIIGARPLDTWDEFVNDIKNMGIDQAVSIQQKAYENWSRR